MGFGGSGQTGQGFEGVLTDRKKACSFQVVETKKTNRLFPQSPKGSYMSYPTEKDHNFQPQDPALSDYSPKDAKWDDLRASTERVSQFLYRAGEFEKWAHRMHDCTGLLRFAELADTTTGEISLKLRYAEFCHARHCPMCQKRREIVYRSRFLEFLPQTLSERPNARWVFLTLTIPNVPVESLRDALKGMNAAWNRFTQRKEFKPVTGWIRTTEVTREVKRKGYAHPHFHCLLMVPPSFFAKNYTKQSRWAEVWGECMRLDVVPSVDVRAVKGGVDKAILETVKTFTYSVKPETLEADQEWTLEYFRQVHKLRFIAAGGALKDAIRSIDSVTDEDMIYTDDNPKPEAPEKELRQLGYSWRRHELKYRRFAKADMPAEE
jgi:plasmid rolling circle replication initiator protein Rep